MKDKYVIDRQHHANLIIEEPEILENIAGACTTPIVNKDALSLYQAENTSAVSKTLTYQTELVLGVSLQLKVVHVEHSNERMYEVSA